MDDAVQALMMAFSVLVFVIGFSIAMYMFSQVTTTAETLTLYADSTAYYDNIRIDDAHADPDFDVNTRIVSAETIVPTLYRYAKEEFCVKIYNLNDSSNLELTQIFDLDLEGNVRDAIGDTRTRNNVSASAPEDDPSLLAIRRNEMLRNVYNTRANTGYYLWGCPWLGSKENIKKRVDFFVNGDAGYIGDYYVDYTVNNPFAEDLNKRYKEQFISYSWDGQTFTDPDSGDTFVTGNKSKDKIVIIYTEL